MGLSARLFDPLRPTSARHVFLLYAATLSLIRGRHYCIADDIHDLALPVLSHRVRLATQADGFVPTRDESEAALREVIGRIPVPL